MNDSRFNDHGINVVFPGYMYIAHLSSKLTQVLYLDFFRAARISVWWRSDLSEVWALHDVYRGWQFVLVLDSVEILVLLICSYAADEECHETSICTCLDRTFSKVDFTRNTN